ncbi:MAG: DUF2806 domain-containing protein [Blastocatellia bacterium]
MADTSILDLGKLGEPFKVLIEKAFNTGEGIFRPFQIKRIAKAEAEADKIKAHSKMEIEMNELQYKAMMRMLVEETRNQENIEAIAQKAIPELTENSQPQNVDPDWTVNFFDKCKITSDEQMQALWAKVLAGETNSPGSFSKRTVNFLAGLEKQDAELFTKLCSFIWDIGRPTPLIYDPRDEIYKRYDMNFDSLQYLSEIGLLNFSSIGELQLGITPEKFVSVSYFKTVYQFKTPQSINTFSGGKATLSKIGEELAPIAGASPIPEFADYILQEWRKRGYIILNNWIV